MTNRYWVIGGDYRDCRFDEIVPGTEEISGPFPDPRRGPYQVRLPGDHVARRTPVAR